MNSDKQEIDETKDLNDIETSLTDAKPSTFDEATDEDLGKMNLPENVNFIGQGEAARKKLSESVEAVKGDEPKKPRGPKFTPIKRIAAWQNYIGRIQLKGMMAKFSYKPKYLPSDETRMQSRSRQNRSKYLGNGELRPVLEVSEASG